MGRVWFQSFWSIVAGGKITKNRLQGNDLGSNNALAHHPQCSS